MIHRTETGAYPGVRAHPVARGGSSITQIIGNNLNKPLPWCVIATAASFMALGIVVSDHARIGDNIEHQAALIHNAENRALDAQQNSLITEQKCNSLEIEMARNGIVLRSLVKK